MSKNLGKVRRKAYLKSSRFVVIYSGLLSNKNEGLNALALYSSSNSACVGE
jgi:hypothetical protein